MFELLNKNIALLLAKKNLTSKELAEAVNIPLPTINRLRSDPNLNPTLGSLLPLCRYFKVTVDQLIGLAPLVFEENSSALKQELKKIPLLSWRQLHTFNDADHARHENFLYSELQSEDHLLASRIDDLDWGPFKKNSLIFISPGKIAGNGDYVVVYAVDDGTVGIKQVIKDINATYLASVIKGISNIELGDRYKILGVILQAKVDY